MSDMKLSIIVCTYNRCEILKYCLDSLEKQSMDISFYEVIVVDNNSTDDTKQVVAEYCSRNSNFRYVFEEKQGLSHARNRGAKESGADWIGYVDDDGKVRENYIELALYTIVNHNFDCFGGKVVNWFKYGKPRWFPEVYDKEKEKYNSTCKYDGFVSGGISFYKKEIILRHGGFSSELGMKGDSMGFGEETKLQIGIRSADGSIGLNPAIVLEHLVPKKKMSILYLLKRSFQIGKNEGNVFQSGNTVKPSLFSILRSLIKNLKGNFFRTFRDDRYYLENYILDILMEALYLLGKRFSN